MDTAGLIAMIREAIAHADEARMTASPATTRAVCRIGGVKERLRTKSAFADILRSSLCHRRRGDLCACAGVGCLNPIAIIVMARMCIARGVMNASSRWGAKRSQSDRDSDASVRRRTEKQARGGRVPRQPRCCHRSVCVRRFHEWGQYSSDLTEMTIRRSSMESRYASDSVHSPTVIQPRALPIRSRQRDVIVASMVNTRVAAIVLLTACIVHCRANVGGTHHRAQRYVLQHLPCRNLLSRTRTIAQHDFGERKGANHRTEQLGLSGRRTEAFDSPL
jgi:hypothetical protein